MSVFENARHAVSRICAMCKRELPHGDPGRCPTDKFDVEISQDRLQLWNEKFVDELGGLKIISVVEFQSCLSMYYKIEFSDGFPGHINMDHRFLGLEKDDLIPTYEDFLRSSIELLVGIEKSGGWKYD